MEDRIFIPSSEWIYFKLYTGTKTADSILKNQLYEFISEMLKNEVIDKWFFIRFSDPDFNIRLRLHLRENRNFSYLFNSFYEICNPLINNGLVWKIQCETYQREIERYGAKSIFLVEEIFFIDSEFVIKLLFQLIESNSELQRWKLALVLIDSFLSAFSFELMQKKELLTSIAENYKREFGFIHHNAKKQLDYKYRSYRKEIENIMSWENTDSDIIYILKDRKHAIMPIANRLNAMEEFDDINISVKSLIISMIHMSMNRWFRLKNRLYEMVIYDFLTRYYASEIAKRNIQKTI